MMNTIDNFRDDYYFLSNFYPSAVIYKGYTYLNNEAAFQAQKTISAYQYDNGEKSFTDERLQFTTLSPGDAKRLGRSVKLRPDWEDIKVNIMHDIVYAKFNQNPELKEKLLATGDTYLIEGNTWGDRVWGQVNGNGRNLLGQILMDVRTEFERECVIEENFEVDAER